MRSTLSRTLFLILIAVMTVGCVVERGDQAIVATSVPTIEVTGGIPVQNAVVVKSENNWWDLVIIVCSVSLIAGILVILWHFIKMAAATSSAYETLLKTRAAKEVKVDPRTQRLPVVITGDAVHHLEQGAVYMLNEPRIPTSQQIMADTAVRLTAVAGLGGRDMGGVVAALPAIAPSDDVILSPFTALPSPEPGVAGDYHDITVGVADGEHADA
jgi:hypothetical protein